MTRQGQYGCVLAALLACLALTIGFVGGSPPAPAPAGGDDIWGSKSSSARPRVPASNVPEGVAVLLVTVIWTACRSLLSGRVGPDSLRRAVTTFSRRRSFG